MSNYHFRVKTEKIIIIIIIICKDFYMELGRLFLLLMFNYTEIHTVLLKSLHINILNIKKYHNKNSHKLSNIHLHLLK